MMSSRLPSAMLSGLILFSLTVCPNRSANAQWDELLGELFPPSIPRAIERGLAPEGNLLNELRSIDETGITTRRQAQALVQLAKALPLPFSGEAVNGAATFTALDRDLYYQISLLYENVYQYAAAYKIVRDQAVPELLRVYDLLADKPTANQLEREAKEVALVHFLKLCAMYQSSAGTDRVIAAVKNNLAADSWSWHEVLAYYDYDHPESLRLYKVIQDNLPELPLGLVVLSVANDRADEENTFAHPFDNDQGMQKLKSWLNLLSPEECYTIVDAIPLLNEARQHVLYAAVAKIDNADLRLHCAEVKARDGEADGYKELAELCLDPRRSVSARRVLEELEKESLIPAAARQRPFVIEAEIYGWLSDNSWNYDYDDQVSITDLTVGETHKLRSYDGELLEFTVVDFRLADDDPLSPDATGICMYGDDIECYFKSIENYFSREDLLSAYFFDSTLAQYVDSESVTEEEFEQARQQWTGPEVAFDIESAFKTTFDEEYNYPQEVVICCPATLNEQAGFAVLDGSRSRFYPGDRFHAGTSTYNIRSLHCGRVLRGLPVDIDRPVLKIDEPEVSPDKVIEYYEGWLDELTSAPPNRRLELFDYDSRIIKHLETYIDAMEESKQLERSEVIVRCLNRILDAFAGLSTEQKKEASDGLSFISEFLHEYAQSPQLEQAQAGARFEQLQTLASEAYNVPWLARLLIKTGKSAEAIAILEPHLVLDGETDMEVLEVLTEALKLAGQIDRAIQLHLEAYRENIRYGADLTSLDESPWLKEMVDEQLANMRQQFPEQIDQALAKADLSTDFQQAVKDYRKSRAANRQKK